MPAIFHAPRIFGVALALWALATTTGSAARADQDATWSGQVGIGAEYDSNVSVDEVDLASSEGDNALLLDAGIAVRKPVTETFDLRGSYDFSQTLYDEFSEVDRQTHLLGTDLTLDAGAVDTGLSLFYIHALLDNDKFLEMYRASPSVSGFLARRWFARGAYVYLDKSIDPRPERDAITHSGEADLYYFVRGLRSYFNLGYRYRDENAEDASLDYISNGVKLRYIQRFELFSRLAKFELSWRYEDRDYRAETLLIGEDRSDQRNRWRADFEIPLYGRSALQVFWSLADYDSNYQPSDYDQDLIGAKLLYRF